MKKVERLYRPSETLLQEFKSGMRGYPGTFDQFVKSIEGEEFSHDTVGTIGNGYKTHALRVLGIESHGFHYITVIYALCHSDTWNLTRHGKKRIWPLYPEDKVTCRLCQKKLKVS